MQHSALADHLSDVIEPANIGRLATDASPAVERELDRRFESIRPSLVRVCASLVGVEDAEDVVHDTYLQARRRVRQLRDPALLEAWLYRIAVNACYGRHRRHRMLARVAERVEGAAAPTRDIGLTQLIELLPPRERTVIVLHYGHGYGLDEIAALLGVRHGTVRSIVSRTRKRLRRDLTEADR